jgi:hypothetical protein
MNGKWITALFAAAAAAFFLVGAVNAADRQAGDLTGQVQRDDVERSFAERPYSPYAGRGFPRRVYWGDTHLHTALSMDAGAFGNRLGMDEAYRFARGEEVVSSSGQAVKLSRPLDFMVIADHSDGMGFFPRLLGGDPQIMKKEEGRKWYKMIQEGQGVDAALEIIGLFSQGKFPWPSNDPDMMRPVWQSVIDAAEKYNEPGVFTAFIGYEWTSLIKGNNLHRVVVYRDNGDRAGRTLPFTLADSADPEDLWDHLQAYEDKTGGQVLAIPHNGNLSNGMMFAERTVKGRKFGKDYARERIRWERVYEVTQIKGDGEAHPFLSPDDEFADYENWDLGNLDLSEAKTNKMLKHEYGRSALKLGLKLQKKLGVNPYQFGMIGSTDSHTSLVSTEEENFFGKHSGAEPSPERATHPFMETKAGKLMGWDQVSSGYAAVWATDNTREALWDAMERREVYATTGSRILVRFFGGWNFEDADARTRFPGDAGYGKGVPMGGELSSAPAGQAPTFLVAALKDPLNGNLDRIQIIKGWVDKKGKEHERIYDVAVSDGREIGGDGRCKTPVGNTVDLATATWTNTIGDPELIAVWKDPDFDPKVPAFYYARVIEIPTPRWTLYDKIRLGAEMPAEVPMTTQERAYTSPIWYTPAS